MTYNLNYVRILTTDFHAAFKFYSEKLGLSVKMGNENDKYAEFNTGSSTLALFQAKDMAKAINLDFCTEQHECSYTALIIFAVDDVNKEFELLKSRGVVFVCNPTERKDWMVKTAHFRDLDGNLIEINQKL